MNEIWNVSTEQTPPAVRKDARARYAAARAAYRDAHEKNLPLPPFPQHERAEAAWSATITVGGWEHYGTGSSERIALQRAILALCHHRKKAAR